MATLLATITKAIEKSGQTRYQIAKGSGVAQSQLSRLVNGEQGMSVANIERVANYLGLEIVVRPKSRKR
jgi:transcriptional regulator with XRE-family HTH domain